MGSAFFILVLLILTTPIFVIYDGPVIYGLVTAATAMSVATIALRIRPREADFLSAVIRPMAAIAAIPAIWMLLQAMPWPNVGLEHPIWKSAAAALGRPLAKSISIDPGATFVSFTRYLSAMASAFVAAAVAIDRARAQWILFGLTMATTLVALMMLAAQLNPLTFPSVSDYGEGRAAATNVTGLGVILAVAAAFHLFERSQTQRPNEVRSATWIWATFVASLAAFVICLLSLVVSAPAQTHFAVSCGLATLAVAVMIRRFGIRSWGIAGTIAIALFVAIAAIAFEPGSRLLGLTLAFAAQGPTPLVMLTQRVLAETTWTGTGAGTFAAILPIYQNIDEIASGHIAPTGAAAVAVEMGRPFLWAVLMGAVALVVMLLRGSLRRQRDSFYSVAGASCIVAIALLSFGNSALLSTPVSVIVAVVVGMAVAQSKSRSI